MLTIVFLKILIDEFTEVQCEIVIYKALCRIIITNHQVGIFTHNMNLAYALLIEFIQKAILFLAISCTAVGNTTYLHGVIDYNKTAFNLHQFRLG